MVSLFILLDIMCIDCFTSDMLYISTVLYRVAQPLFLAQMLQYFSPGSTISRTEACWYAGGVVLCTGASVIITNPVWLGSLMLAMKMRVACSSIIYRKVRQFMVTLDVTF